MHFLCSQCSVLLPCDTSCDHLPCQASGCAVCILGLLTWSSFCNPQDCRGTVEPLPGQAQVAGRPEWLGAPVAGRPEWLGGMARTGVLRKASRLLQGRLKVLPLQWTHGKVTAFPQNRQGKGPQCPTRHFQGHSVFYPLQPEECSGLSLP